MPYLLSSIQTLNVVDTPFAFQNNLDRPLLPPSVQDTEYGFQAGEMIESSPVNYLMNNLTASLQQLQASGILLYNKNNDINYTGNVGSTYSALQGAEIVFYEDLAQGLLNRYTVINNIPTGTADSLVKSATTSGGTPLYVILTTTYYTNQASTMRYVLISNPKTPQQYLPNLDTYEYCVGDVLNVGASINLTAAYNNGTSIVPRVFSVVGSYWNQNNSTLGTHINPFAEAGAINLIKTTKDGNGNGIQYITTFAPNINNPANPKIEFVFSRVSINSTSWGVWVMEKGELPTIYANYTTANPPSFADYYMYGFGVLYKRQAYITDNGSLMSGNIHSQYYGFHLILNGVPFTSGKSATILNFTNSSGVVIPPQNKNFNYASMGGVVLQACDLEPTNVGDNSTLALRVYNPNFQNGTYQVALEGLSYI